MFFKLPFFHLFLPKTSLDGLVDHYNKIAECVALISDSLECYISGMGLCKEFNQLRSEVDRVENEADEIKRYVRNKLPRRMFLNIDKTLFFNYTKAQDNILDAAQDAVHWLAMRQVDVPEDIQKHLIDLLDHVSEISTLLGPALKSTIGLFYGEHIDRESTKEKIQSVRKKRYEVTLLRNDILRLIYNTDVDFKDIYQLIHFVECLDDMCHNSENCVDILRAMIAR